MASNGEGFILLERVEEMDIVLHKVLQKFPKSERHVLSAEIRSNVAEIHRHLVYAQKFQALDLPRKRPPIRALDRAMEVDVRIHFLKKQLRKAKELKFIDEASFWRVTELVNECGKILGGWWKTLVKFAPNY